MLRLVTLLRETFHSCPSDTRRLECADVNKPLQQVFKSVYI